MRAQADDAVGVEAPVALEGAHRARRPLAVRAVERPHRVAEEGQTLLDLEDVGAPQGRARDVEGAQEGRGRRPRREESLAPAAGRGGTDRDGGTGHA